MSKPPKPPRKPQSKSVEDDEDLTHRTVRLVISEDSLINEDSLFRALSRFGTIMDISLKGKSGGEDSVLFSSSKEAKRCAASFHETVLGSSAKARYFPDIEKEEQLSVQNISAVGGANQTELLDLEDVSNFDRTALSATINDSVESGGNFAAAGEEGSTDNNDNNAQDSGISKQDSRLNNISANSSLEIPKPSSSPSGGGWKVAEKQTASPPQKPPRQMKGESASKSPTEASQTAYISSDNTNDTSGIISAYQERFESTADASMSNYNDYLGDSVTSDVKAVPTPVKSASEGIAGRSTSSPAPTSTAIADLRSGSQEKSTRIGLFTNIYETTDGGASAGAAGGHSASSPSHSRSPPRSRGVPAGRAGDDVMELKSRIKVLEAEARVRAKERIEFDLEMHKMEVGWSTELTAVSIRNKNLEDQNKNLKEEQRKANVEMSRLIAQLACLEAAKENAEMKVGNAKGKSDREAMGTVLAQQKLLSVMEEHAKASDAKVALLKEENDSLSGRLEALTAELTDWKARALSSEKRAREATEINESILKSDKNDKESDAGNAVPPVMSVENATRRILNEEMEKYLSLERSSAIPVLARADNNALAWQYQPRESSFGDYFDVAKENEELYPQQGGAAKQSTVPSNSASTTAARLRKYGRV